MLGGGDERQPFKWEAEASWQSAELMEWGNKLSQIQGFKWGFNSVLRQTVRRPTWVNYGDQMGGNE